MIEASRLVPVGATGARIDASQPADSQLLGIENSDQPQSRQT